MKKSNFSGGSQQSREEVSSLPLKKINPYIPASQVIPEITFKSIILGIILSMILGGSNAYLGLKIGQTITGCIPAAIVSMTILRLFKNSNILENNIVQTAASAGEVVAATIIFTVPALIIIGFWQQFDYIQTTLIAALGGTLGVLFSIPLRRALVVESSLPFPEGVATAEVLKAGDGGGKSARYIIKGGVLAACIQFAQSGLQIFASEITKWTHAFGTIFGLGVGLSPVLIGAGYIIGFQISISLLAGALITYVISIPLYGHDVVSETKDALLQAGELKKELRYMGVGCMVIGGLLTLSNVFQPIKSAIMSSFEALKKSSHQKMEPLRTDKDVPILHVFVFSALLILPIFFLVQYVFDSINLPISMFTYAMTLCTTLLMTFIVGFLCASIGGYMSGLVGSSCNPITGIVISSCLLIASLILVTLGIEIDFHANTQATLGAAAAVIIISAIVATVAGMSSDNLQDLKSGQIVGATPWKQQVMLIIGVFASAAVITPILNVLFEAYGMGGMYPRAGMDPSKNLPAPQAVLLAMVAKGVFTQDVPYKLLSIGGAVALVSFLIDKYLQKKNARYRLPPLGVALGLYLPAEVTFALVLGGLVQYYASKRLNKNITLHTKSSTIQQTQRRGILFASGMIAGEALMGIALAAPFAASQSTDLFKFTSPFFDSTHLMWGLLTVCGLGYYLYRTSSTLQE